MARTLFKHIFNTQLCIVGGGMSGICAALAAARLGTRVVLIQDRSVLGGNASSEIRMHIVGADFHGKKPGTRETGLIEELRLEDAFRNPHRSYSQWDLLLYEKIIAETNITLLLDTQFTSCRTEQTPDGLRIIELTANRLSTEEEFIVRAQFFADCSGDGVLGADAGAKFRTGRESKSEFSESLAVEKADKNTLGNSILFMARPYSTPQPYLAPDWVRSFTAADFVNRPIPSFEYGYWWFEWGGHLDTIRDNDAIRHELLRIALGVWNYVKNSGDYPAAAHWALDWVGSIPGKRESRRFIGHHVLTQDDVFGGRIFSDTVAYGGWPVDLHPPTGVDAVNEPPCTQHDFDNLFGIPLRSLYSINIGNLFFAGRNISATHVAFASTRVMATCSVMGQAVGTAAAVMNRYKDIKKSIDEMALICLQDIQLELMRQDAFLPGFDFKDPQNLAGEAILTASSFQKGHPPENLHRGVTRHLRREWGKWSEDRLTGWFSQEIPAYLKLEWQEPQNIRKIHLIFDSGLERELILSASDRTSEKTIRGAQLELVRDYEIRADGKILFEIKNNFLRSRIHVLPEAIRSSSLEIHVKAAHNISEARIMSIRIYAA